MAEAQRLDCGDRRVVATYSSYGLAQRAIDLLVDKGFPVARTSIVGEGIRFVESIKGPWGYSAAAAQGMFNGAVVGALFGFVLGPLGAFERAAGVSALYGLLFGTVAGLIVGPSSHWFWRGRRDFTSMGDLEATRFEIHVDDEVAERALGILRTERLVPVR